MPFLAHVIIFFSVTVGNVVVVEETDLFLINALDTVAAYENAIVILRLPLVPVPDTAVAGMMNYRVSQENVVIVGVCHQSIEVIIFSLNVLKT